MDYLYFIYIFGAVFALGIFLFVFLGEHQADQQFKHKRA